MTVYVTFQARSRCFLCGYQHKVISMGDVRVNRRSLRQTGTWLTSAGQRTCPECGEPNLGELIPVSVFRLCEEDAAKVAALRARRWGDAA